MAGPSLGNISKDETGGVFSLTAAATLQVYKNGMESEDQEAAEFYVLHMPRAWLYDKRLACFIEERQKEVTDVYQGKMYQELVYTFFFFL